ncbi:PhnD/SsuA/transferrin family substrate-binding protein [Sulfurimonas aquatica]|uniref:PhnD/SsuA/transferrin family substrate-binding protein n=1 Tax=Sulfurimonas aquatica TaxID=2672570 RepID=A0A975AYQ0_9BACT|nr:PhnD/SsuA/transferrin family substrate-binding protein [Sulfurimonas aquatica]QSZ40994.1 PhnD/SsuA/transferrin family substrate-binding protein [Sulfurimonas aquatica]
MKYYLLPLLLTLTLHAGHMNVAYGNASMNQFSKKDTMIVMDIWIQEIMKTTKHSATFFFYDSSTEMAKDFEERKLDLVITTGVEFVKSFEKSNLVKAFTGGSKEKHAEDIIVVLPAKKSLQELYSKKDPKVALQESEEIAMIYIEKNFFEKNKEAKIEYIKTRKRNAAILKLFFGKADAAVVTKKTFDFAKELNPQIGKKLKIAKLSTISARTFGFFHKDFNPEMAEEIRSFALAIGKSARGQQILTVFQTDKVVETTVKDLEPIGNIYKEYIALKKENNK